jgi:valyl-tRNA synthetase
MDKTYRPEKQEEKIYNFWQKTKAFTPHIDKKKKPFSIIMPPPNANAPLHIGHAMYITLEDIMARFYRMLGYSTLLLPGADHASIATQVAFEKQLAKKGKTRHDLGRKKFYNQCKQFTLDNKKIMYNQTKKVGASCDWTRERFTLDPKINTQVLKTFIQLHKDGLAYRGDRLINWCPRCSTALSNLEVVHKEIKESIYEIKYPLKTESSITGQQRFLIVATTRPETMLGDTAVAVHPDDKRYKQFIGKTAILPLLNRELPIIADRKIDQEFGTGVVKITPAHDPDDWDIGLRHRLIKISIIGFNNKMTKKAGEPFVGLKIKEARQKIIDLLIKDEFLVKEKKIIHNVGFCERCDQKIQPLISKQWFINVNKRKHLNDKKLEKRLNRKTASLNELGIMAIKKGFIKIIPRRFQKNYFNWMYNLHDWCISRQLWWGQRMPIWYCGTKGLSDLQKQMNPDLTKKRKGCGHTIISLTKPKSCPKCRKRTTIIQDPDTFDTWFSSGQWPYNALGFPSNKDYKYFYPTTVLETGYEILFFWVARMIMLGLYRTKKEPFKYLYLHGLVRDAFGEKMSKSKGNVIEPIAIAQQYGADALRMALVANSSPGNDLNLGEDKIKGYRNFSNKVWNIGRYILISLKSTRKRIPWYKKKITKKLAKEDKQIIKKLEKITKKTTRNLQKFKFAKAGEDIYQFLWNDFANKYLEKTKDRVRKKDIYAISTLRHVYFCCLKLLHPFIPFVTEAVWQQIPEYYRQEKDLITSRWPTV